MYAMEQPIAVRATESARAAFIRRTYAHLAGAILAFVIIEFLLLRLPNIERIVIGMAGSGVTRLVIVGALIGVSFLADVWARSDTSPGLQYLGLSLYVVAEAVIFLPLLYLASIHTDRTIIPTSGIFTL